MTNSKILYLRFCDLRNWVVKEYDYYTYKCSKIHPSKEDKLRYEILQNKQEQLRTITATALQEYLQRHPHALDSISKDYN